MHTDAKINNSIQLFDNSKGGSKFILKIKPYKKTPTAIHKMKLTAESCL
jgi:hypothetical protein